MAAPTRGRTGLQAAIERAWQRRGALSTALLPAAWLFAIVVEARRALFVRGTLASSRLPVPVVVVGNLVAGGAGKTPATIAVVGILRQAGLTPGVVSRGYGRRSVDVVSVTASSAATNVGDEPLLIHRRTGAAVVVGRDRLAAAHALLASAPAVDVIVSDDGLQHLALERDAEVLVFDERGAGNGRLLPAGPLRERVPSRAHARRLVLYNAPMPTTPLPGFISRRSLGGIWPLAAWWRGDLPSPSTLETLRGRTLVAVAGLARPQRFFDMLRASGLSIDEMPLDDHHDFAALPWPSSTGDVIVTEKDAVKLPLTRETRARVWVAALDFEPEPAFGAALLAMLGLASPPPPPAL